MEIDEEADEILEEGALPLVPPPPMPTLTSTPKFGKGYTIKCSLLSFCPDKALRNMINEGALRIHEIVVEAHHLLNIVLRVQYEEAFAAKVVPHQESFTEAHVMQFFYAVTDRRKKISNELRRICEDHYDPLVEKHKICLVDHKGLPLAETARRIAATIRTNIIRHFFRRQFKYLRAREGLDKKEARKLQDKINGEKQKDDSLPAGFLASKDNIAYYLACHPEEFLNPMYLMNKLLEEKKKKLFALLPLSRGFVPGAHLHLDTTALCTLVGSGNEHVQAYEAEHQKRVVMENAKKTTEEKKKRRKPGRDTSDAAMEEKDKLWNGLFDISKVAAPSRVQNNRIRFGHHITTDGVSVSAMIYAEGDAPEKKKKKKKKTARVGATPGVNWEFEGQDVVIIGVDPGKYNLVYMTTEEVDPKDKRKSGKSLRYTTAQRRHESGELPRKKELDAAKTEAIQNAQDELSSTNSRVTSVADFKKYLEKRYEVQSLLYKHYRESKHRLYRFLNWRGRRSSEDRFIQRVKKTFKDRKQRMSFKWCFIFFGPHVYLCCVIDRDVTLAWMDRSNDVHVSHDTAF